jgi:hypothetical protein
MALRGTGVPRGLIREASNNAVILSAAKNPYTHEKLLVAIEAPSTPAVSTRPPPLRMTECFTFASQGDKSKSPLKQKKLEWGTRRPFRTVDSECLGVYFVPLG